MSKKVPILNWQLLLARLDGSHLQRSTARVDLEDGTEAAPEAGMEAGMEAGTEDTFCAASVVRLH